jgi:hypothetical protein
MSAAEYLVKNLPNLYTTAEQQEQLEKLLINFADNHVRSALQKAYKAALITQADGSKCKAFGTNRHESGGFISAEIDKHSITNAYPKNVYIL